MRTYTFHIVLLAALPLSAFAQPEGSLVHDLFDPPCTRGGALHLSECAVVVSTALDVQSSRGLYEVNPIVGRGQFGARQIATVAAVSYGWMLLQRYLVRRQPGVEKWVTWINVGVSGAHGYAATRNWSHRVPGKGETQ